MKSFSFLFFPTVSAWNEFYNADIQHCRFEKIPIPRPFPLLLQTSWAGKGRSISPTKARHQHIGEHSVEQIRLLSPTSHLIYRRKRDGLGERGNTPMPSVHPSIQPASQPVVV
ncbi:unnamed protein product [Periconia digitata]|uniref:Uncharacterized protein n=1 Tax=Periconia digitata TaxID=1303443 RepID=A0A9W4XQV5_9PLEO|nr:unnamed protein product [Periconia digitata]